MQNTNRELFEETPIPVAVQKMMIPTIIGALVTVLYSLADTLFVGMINDEIQNAAVALAAPALLAFNAVNNLFGVGSSSMMSRALGRGDMKTVRASASFGFYGAVASGALLSALCLIFMYPFVTLLGGDASTAAATISYMALGGRVRSNPDDFKCGDGIYGAVGRCRFTCQHRNDEWMYLKYDFRSNFYSSMGIWHGSSRSRVCDIFVKLFCMLLFLRLAVCPKEKE